MLQSGTYARERDGAWHLYHSPTRWNDAAEGLRRYLSGESTSSLYEWRLVTDPEELRAVDEYVGVPANSGLLPGEYVEVTA